MESEFIKEQGITREELHPSALPYYIVGLIWIIYALIFPLYRIQHYVILIIVSAIAFFISSKVIPPKRVEVFIPVKEKFSGDKTADELLTEGRRLIGDIRAIGNKIQNPLVTAEIVKILNYLQKIFHHIAEKPEKAKRIRKMVNYHLPSVVKILNSYEDMENQSVSSENISTTMKKIEGSLPDISKALEKLLDSLYLDEAMDISTDLTVLEKLLAAEGLSGKETLNNKNDF